MLTTPAPCFLSVPREIRNEIYRHLFVFENPDIDAIAHERDAGIGESPYDFQPAHENEVPNVFRYQRQHLSIFRVCRQVYSEASEIFYSANTFPVFVHIRPRDLQEIKASLSEHWRRSRDDYTERTNTVVVTYSTPWENLEYACDSWEILKHYQTPICYRPIGGRRPAGALRVPNAPHSALPRQYGRLIQNLRIHCQISLDLTPGRMKGSMMHAWGHLLPLANRINSSCPNALKTITLGHHEAKHQVSATFMNLTWPLVAAGRYTISTAPAAPLDHGLESVLRGCLREVPERTIEMQDPDIQLEQDCYWAMMKGVLVVQAEKEVQPESGYKYRRRYIHPDIVEVESHPSRSKLDYDYDDEDDDDEEYVYRPYEM